MEKYEQVYKAFRKKRIWLEWVPLTKVQCLKNLTAAILSWNWHGTTIYQWTVLIDQNKTQSPCDSLPRTVVFNLFMLLATLVCNEFLLQSVQTSWFPDFFLGQEHRLKITSLEHSHYRLHHTQYLNLKQWKGFSSWMFNFPEKHSIATRIVHYYRITLKRKML